MKRGKSDSIDAEAICEAASRPTMRFVPVKTIEQQSLATLHRSRDLPVKNRTMLINALRGHLAEFGFISGALPHDALRAAWAGLPLCPERPVLAWASSKPGAVPEPLTLLKNYLGAPAGGTTPI